jgi:hypothetical protein
MQIIGMFGTALLLSTTVIAAPRSKNAGGLVRLPRFMTFRPRAKDINSLKSVGVGR